MVRVTLILLVLLTAASAVGASAATLGGSSSPTVASGGATVARCDADGVTATYTTSGGNVVQMTVGDIADPACEGGTIRITLVDAANAAIASGGPTLVPADGDTSANAVTLDTWPTPDAATVAGYRVSIAGP